MAVASSLIVIFSVTIYLVTDNYVSENKDTEIQRINKIVAEYKANEKEENKSITRIILEICEEEGIDPDMVMQIVIYESKLNRYFQGVCKDGTVDRGVFGLNSYWYEHISDECAFSVSCSARVFAEAFKAGKINDWLSVKVLGLKVD